MDKGAPHLVFYRVNGWRVRGPVGAVTEQLAHEPRSGDRRAVGGLARRDLLSGALGRAGADACDRASGILDR
ncbi:hypothetical protein GCM10023222_02890 [Saccharopolyspora cebuensis]